MFNDFTSYCVDISLGGGNLILMNCLFEPITEVAIESTEIAESK